MIKKEIEVKLTPVGEKQHDLRVQKVIHDNVNVVGLIEHDALKKMTAEQFLTHLEKLTL